MKKKLLCALSVLLFLAGMAVCGVRDAAVDGGRQDAQEKQGGERVIYHARLPEKREDADIFIEPVEGISEDSIRGMDVSDVAALEESGAIYYNAQGEPEDFLRILADAGVNYIRVKVWNGLYDVEKAADIGARAAQNGMKLLVDFTYSDLLADEKKQSAPKAWAQLSWKEKQQAVYDFTKESLREILAAGAEIGMVQIGNGINHGLAGENGWERIAVLLKQAGKAVRGTAEENGQEIKITVHVTDIDDHGQTVGYARALADAGVDYDVFGVSYYPYWHGTMEHMAAVLKDIQNAFGKETVVLETAYCYTLESGDGFTNRVSKKDLVEGYTASVQSQATCVRDVMAAATRANALGIFYGAWALAGDGAYDGIPVWDNQAMFDATGHPLASLNVFKYLEYGASCEKEVDYIKEANAVVHLGGEVQMPQTVEVVYNDRSLNAAVPVVWNERQLGKVRTDKAGAYTIEGRLADGMGTVCQLTVTYKNWLINPGFEKNDISMWKISYKGDSNPTDIRKKELDAKSGENSLHFGSEKTQSFQAEQTVSGLEAGTYTASASIQGGDIGPLAKIYLYVVANGKMLRSKLVKLTGFCKWKKPKIAGIALDGKTDLTVGMKVKCAGGGWGTMDDFSLIKTK